MQVEHPSNKFEQTVVGYFKIDKKPMEGTERSIIYLQGTSGSHGGRQPSRQ